MKTEFLSYMPCVDLTAATLQQKRLEHLAALYTFDGECSGEDALDQDTVQFDDVDAELALDAYDADAAEDREETHYDPVIRLIERNATREQIDAEIKRELDMWDIWDSIEKGE